MPKNSKKFKKFYPLLIKVVTFNLSFPKLSQSHGNGPHSGLFKQQHTRMEAECCAPHRPCGEAQFCEKEPSDTHSERERVNTIFQGLLRTECKQRLACLRRVTPWPAWQDHMLVSMHRIQGLPGSKWGGATHSKNLPVAFTSKTQSPSICIHISKNHVAAYLEVDRME